MPGVVTQAVTKRVAIEQCIARGETVIDICKRLRVSEADVCDVWLRMDRINEQPDVILPPRTSKPAKNPDPAPRRLAVVRGPVQAVRESWPDHRVQPCGTHASHNRHLYRGEEIDVACARAERLYQAARNPRRKQGGVA